MENAIPPGLVEQVPQLVVMLLVVGAVLAFFWKLWQANTAFHDKWFERHEQAEKEQMTVIGSNTKASEHVATAVANLAERIGHSAGPDFPILSNPEPPLTHTISTPHPDASIGVPGGRFEPDVTYSRNALLQAGESAAWTIAKYGIDKLHAAGIKGAGARVVVIDTGVDADHPDLAANVDRPSCRSFVPGESFADGNGHGSHCMGIICADDNGGGVVGVAPDAKVSVAYKGLSNAGSGGDNGLANAITTAADLPGHRIFSMSFGSSQESRAISNALRYAKAKGHWLVAAAGNAGPGSVNWPGALPEVVCVGATDPNDRVAGFSSANEFVDVGFGGVQILSTIPGGRYAPMSGTSMATPGVAGVLALAAGELVRLGLPIPDQDVMAAVLYATCRDVGDPGRDNGVGYGIVQPAEFVAALVKKAGGGGPKPPTPSDPPAEWSIDYNDLTADAKARLGRSGVVGFKMAVQVA